MDQISLAEPLAKSGQVVLSPEAATALVEATKSPFLVTYP